MASERKCTVHLKFLNESEGVHYDTRRTADEILECLADYVNEEAKAELIASPFVAVIADVTTSITSKKRLR